jgi:hypothetical protein
LPGLLKHGGIHLIRLRSSGQPTDAAIQHDIRKAFSYGDEYGLASGTRVHAYLEREMETWPLSA